MLRGGQARSVLAQRWGHPSTPSSWYLSSHTEPLAVFSVCLHQAFHLLHTNRAFRNVNCPAVTLFISSLLTACRSSGLVTQTPARIRTLVRSKMAGLKEQGHTVGGNDTVVSLSLEWKGLLCFRSEGQISSGRLPQSYSCRVFTLASTLTTIIKLPSTLGTICIIQLLPSYPVHNYHLAVSMVVIKTERNLLLPTSFHWLCLHPPFFHSYFLPFFPPWLHPFGMRSLTNIHPPSSCYFWFRSNTFNSMHYRLLCFSQGLLGSTFETGWDNLASQAATTEWCGEGMYVAFVA